MMMLTETVHTCQNQEKGKKCKFLSTVLVTQSWFNVSVENIKSTINDIEERLNKPTVSIDIDEHEVDLIADKLVGRWGSVKWRSFYCLVARSLPQAKIWDFADIADEKGTRSKGGYFNVLACKAMNYTPNRKGDSHGL